MTASLTSAYALVDEAQPSQAARQKGIPPRPEPAAPEPTIVIPLAEYKALKALQKVPAVVPTPVPAAVAPAAVPASKDLGKT